MLDTPRPVRFAQRRITSFVQSTPKLQPRGHFVSENPPTGPQYGSDPNQPQYPQNPAGNPPPGNYPPPSGNPPQGGGYPPPGGNYPPPGGYPPPGSYPPPPGNYPPPPGNYPPPPGNYPPPPGNYGAAGYGGGVPPTLSVGDAISFGWNKFKDNAGVWVGIILIAAVIQIVLSFIFRSNSTDFSALYSVWSIIGTIVSTVVGYLINAALIRGALHEVDGNKPAFGSFFQFANVAAVIIASVLVGIATAVGLILLVIPGIVVVFLTWWTLQFVVDRNEDAITAIKSSFRAISSNAGQLFVLALALFGINIVGAIPCGLGLLVTIPITVIASTYAYRIVSSNPALG